jgi:hypothetical protein
MKILPPGGLHVYTYAWRPTGDVRRVTWVPHGGQGEILVTQHTVTKMHLALSIYLSQGTAKAWCLP